VFTPADRGFRLGDSGPILRRISDVQKKCGTGATNSSGTVLCHARASEAYKYYSGAINATAGPLLRQEVGMRWSRPGKKARTRYPDGDSLQAAVELIQK